MKEGPRRPGIDSAPGKGGADKNVRTTSPHHLADFKRTAAQSLVSPTQGERDSDNICAFCERGGIDDIHEVSRWLWSTPFEGWQLVTFYRRSAAASDRLL